MTEARVPAEGVQEANDRTFVLLNDGWDEKTSICYPDIYGPFRSEEEARDFLKQHPRYLYNADFAADVLCPIDGGYAGAHIVNTRTASDPAEALTQWKDETL